jgi:hypothetical protein
LFKNVPEFLLSLPIPQHCVWIILEHERDFLGEGVRKSAREVK